MNPLDYIYQAVGCKIQLLTEDCAESQYILKYIHASCKLSIQTYAKGGVV